MAAQITFEFRESGDGVGLYCHKIGAFTARGLEVIKDAITEQWQKQLAKEDESGGPGTPSTSQVDALDPYDPKRYDPEQYDPKRYEV